MFLYQDYWDVAEFGVKFELDTALREVPADKTIKELREAEVNLKLENQTNKEQAEKFKRVIRDEI